MTSGRIVARRFLAHWRLMLTAVLSLGAAMTATVVGLGVFNAVMLRPPGVAVPRDVLSVYVRTPDEPFDSVSFEDYRYLRDHNRVFSGLAAFPFTIGGFTLADGDRREPVNGTMVSSNYFDVLGVQPLAGRLAFASEDTRASDTIVVSQSLWQRLGADPGIVGRTVRLNHHAVTIIGIVPRTFGGMTLAWEPDVFVPLRTMQAMNGESPGVMTDRTARWLHPVGRLKPGVSVEQAQADVELLSRRLAADHPASDKDRVAFLTPTTIIPPSYRPTLRSVFGVVIAIVALTLIAACSNVTNLLLALATMRRHEMLVRTALGASRRQLMWPVLGESVLVGLLAGAVGFALATLALRWLSSLRLMIGAGIPPPSFDLHPDLRLGVAMLAIVLIAGLATGLVPAWRAASDGLLGSLNRESVAGGTHRARVRHLLVVIQMAVATLILIGVGVSLRSLANLQRVDVGFTARNFAIAGIDLRLSGYDEAHGRPFYERVREALALLPGVESISVANEMPIGLSGGARDRVRGEHEARPANDRGVETSYGVVDSNYFSTLGITLLEGRTFDTGDTATSPEVIVINRTMARQRWPNEKGENPIGQRLHIENGNRFARVIGIVADGKYEDLDEAPLPYMYFALSQHYQPDVSVIARTSGRASAWIAPITQTLTRLDPNLAFGLHTFEDHMQIALLLPMFILATVSGLGALALVLAIVGLYGTVFYSVSQRRNEMGVRVALGAQPRDLFRMVLRQTAHLALAGVTIGVLVSLALQPIVSSLFYGVRPVETLVIATVVTVSVSIAMATAYVAARPWTRMSALEMVRRV
jgi:predicted permease